MTSVNTANHDVSHSKTFLSRGFESTLKNLEMMKKKSYPDDLQSRDNQKKTMMEITFLIFALISKRPKRRLGLSIRWAGPKSQELTQAPLRTNSLKEQETGRQKQKHLLVIFLKQQFLSFKRPKLSWIWESGFPLLETEQAYSTFKHLPVFPAAEGGVPCREHGEGCPRKGLQRCLINPIKQVDGEGLADNLHLANEACDS